MFTRSFVSAKLCTLTKEWLQKFDCLLLKIITTWSSNIVIMGDFNTDLVKQSDNICVKYRGIVTKYELTF